MHHIAFWLSLILIFMIPWENGVTIENLGTLTRAIGLFAVGFWVFSVLTTGRLRKPHAFHLAVWVFVIWNIVSFFWTFGLDETMQRIVTYAQLFGMTWLLWDLYTTPATLRAGLQAYILGAFVSIGSTLFNYLTGQEAYAYSGGRYTGSNLNAVDLALILALGIPVAWHLAAPADDGTKSYGLRLINYAYIPGALFAIMLTASRMALLAIIPAFLFILGTVARLKLSSRVLIFGALTGALFALQPYIPQSSITRLSSTGISITLGDIGGRADIWRTGIAVFSEHPLWGVGSGAFRTVVQFNSVAHNTYLSVLAELGIAGFALFLIILAIAVYHAIRQARWDSGFWLTVLMVWAVGVFALTWEQRKPTWLFLTLVVVSAGLSSQRDESTLRPGLVRQLPRGSGLGPGGKTLPGHDGRIGAGGTLYLGKSDEAEGTISLD